MCVCRGGGGGGGQGLSQDLETWCPKLAKKIKIFGRPKSYGGPQNTQISTIIKHVYIHQNKAWYPYAMSWELRGDEKIQLYA